MSLTDDEIQRIQSLSDSELWTELGEAIYEHAHDGLGARPPSAKQLVDIARAWFARERDTLRSRICGNAGIRQIVQSKPNSREKLARVVADVVSALVIYLPAGTVAEIAIRDGIAELCHDTWLCQDESDAR